MTYRTLDRDHAFSTRHPGAEQPSDSAPLRHLRARRRAGALHHRAYSVGLSGFGL